MWLCSFYFLRSVVLEVRDLSGQLEQISPPAKKAKVYSSLNHLRRDMLCGEEVYSEFVTGSKCGSASMFFCRMCDRDVSMASRGKREFKRHFMSDHHWERDVKYRVHRNLPVFNKLRESIVLSADRREHYLSLPFVPLNCEYPFPEDALPKHSRPDSKVPLMTMISSLMELLQSGGSYTLLRRLWGHFRATLSEQDPVYEILWDNAETLVSVVSFLFLCYFPLDL